MEHLKNLQWAHLTESELKKIKETETFLNEQPDHQSLKEEGKEIYLLAFVDDSKKK